MTTLSPASGVLLGGRYRLTSRIATGGMGEVWAATDEVLDRRVAVKVLKRELGDDEAFLTRFRAEARHTAALAHPGIAAVFDYGEADGVAFLVMELVPGRPLSEVLAAGPLPPATALRVVGQAALALQTAHDAGVVHRDVKPGNLLVCDDGTVKVTDFGIARAADAVPLTRTGTVLGTAQYLSPEQATGRDATAASDVYALGIVGYEALAGRRPFTGDNALAVALAQVHDEPPPLPPRVPAAAAALVLAALAKDPASRPASAGAFGRDALALAAELDPATPATPAFGLGAAAAAGATAAGARAAADENRPSATAGADETVLDLRAPGSSVPPPPIDATRVMSPIAGSVSGVREGGRAGDGGAPPAVVPETSAEDPHARERRRALLAVATVAVVFLAVLVVVGAVAGTGSASEPASPPSPSPTPSSTGPRMVTVDAKALEGKPYDEAAATLKALGLQVTRAVRTSTAAADTVVDVSPSGSVPVGTRVTLTVAAPPATTPASAGPGGGPKGDGKKQPKEHGGPGKGGKGAGKGPGKHGDG